MITTNFSNQKRFAQSVLGMVEEGDIGITLPHEHLKVDASLWFIEPEETKFHTLAHEPVSINNLYWIRYNSYNNLDNMRLIDEEVAVKEAMHFKHEGGKTIVDLGLSNVGRDPLALARISKATGLNIIMGCGWYVGEAQGPDFDSKTVDLLAQEIISEIQDGVSGSGIRPGIIGEIGCSWPLHEREKKSLRASALAQQETGAAITIHPGRHENSPLEIIEFLDNAGADINRVVMGHLDRTDFSMDTLSKIANTGCNLEV